MPLTSGCSNINSVKEDDDSSIKDNVDDNFNNETITEEEKERETLKTLVFNNLNENNHYNIKRDSYITFISDKNVPTKIGFIGEVIFNQSNVSYSSLDLDYSYSNKVESISLINNFSINSTLKHNNNIVTFDSNSDLTYMLNYLNLNEGYKDAPTFSYNNLSLSTVFNNVFNSLFSDKETSKYTTIDDSININESSILVKNNEYSLYLDDSFNIKRIAKNNKNSKDINLPIQDLDLSLTNTYNNVSKLNENSDNIFTTLFEYFEDSALNIDFDINVDSSKNFHFIGDMNLDFTNSSLVNNNKFDINFLHYTNKNTANDKVYLRYENNNAYFEIYENLDIYQNTDNKDPFLKGRMSDTGISSLLDVVSNYTDIDFNEYVNMPLNSLFNTTSFKEISTTQDISSYLSSIKSYSLKNNLLSLKIDSSVFGLPESILDIKIGLHNLKLKTIEIKNLRVDEETTIDASLRINDLIELKPYDLSSFPSYDFLPGMIESVTSLINRKTLGGKMSFQLFDLKNNSNIGFSSNIDLNASKLDFNNLSLDSISNFDLALTNFGISGIDETIASIMNMVKGIYVQDSPLTNEKSLIVEIELLGELKFIVIPFSDINSLITTILELFSNFDTSINIDFEKITSTINYYLDLVLENYELTQDIEYIMDNISLRPLEKFLKIDVNEKWETLEITIDPEYIFQYEMAVNDPSFSPYIKILYDTKFQELIGIYVNMATHDGNYAFNFSYSYDDFNKSNFVGSEINEDNQIYLSEIIDLIDLFTAQKNNKFDIENLPYIINAQFKPENTETIYEASGDVLVNGLTNFTEGNLDINQINGTFNKNLFNLLFKYNLPTNQSSTKGDGSSSSTMKYDGITYTQDNGGNIELNDTLVANLSLGENLTPYKIVSPTSTSSLIKIIDALKDLPEGNILYPQLSTIINALNTTFFIQFLLSEDNKDIELISNKFFKISDVSLKKDIVSAKLKLNPVLLLSKEEGLATKIPEDWDVNPDYPKAITLDVQFSKQARTNEEGKTINYYSLETATCKNVQLNGFGSISLDFDLDENKNDGTSSILPSNFIDYNKENSNEFINVKDLENLLLLGLNTTNNTYFEISGTLDINLHIGGVFSFILNWIKGDILEPVIVNAKVQVYKKDEALTAQTRAHLTLQRKNNQGYLNDETNYVEYFTERTEDGTEICYISKLKGSYIEKQTQTIKEQRSEPIGTTLTNTEENRNEIINLIDDKLGTKWSSSPYFTYKHESTNRKKDDIIGAYSNWSEETAKSELDDLRETFNDPTLGRIDSFERGGFFIKWTEYCITLDKDCYDLTAIIQKHEVTTREESYAYDIETFKVTQSELLKSSSYQDSAGKSSIPNIIYYLLDYAMLGSPGLFVDRSDITGLLYNQFINAEPSGTSLDLDFAKYISFEVSESDKQYTLNIELGKLLGMEANLLPIKVVVGYNDDNTLSYLELSKKDESSDTYLFNMSFGELFGEPLLSINADVTFQTTSIKYLVTAEGHEFDRYDDFIYAFNNYEGSKNLNYREILYYQDNGSYMSYDLSEPVFNQNSILNTRVDSLDQRNTIEYGFISGLFGYDETHNP